jgi:hypothetical protein
MRDLDRQKTDNNNFRVLRLPLGALSLEWCFCQLSVVLVAVSGYGAGT